VLASYTSHVDNWSTLFELSTLMFGTVLYYFYVWFSIFSSFVNDYSRMSWMYLLKDRSQDLGF